MLNPRMSRRETERLLRRMGISMEELNDVKEVKITMANNRTIVVKNPQVLKLMASGNPIFQVTGEILEEVETEPYGENKFSEEDVLFVSSQTGKPPEEARKALLASEGDLAKAILMLKGGF